jgi:hypothetical protein
MQWDNCARCALRRYLQVKVPSLSHMELYSDLFVSFFAVETLLSQLLGMVLLLSL